MTPKAMRAPSTPLIPTGTASPEPKASMPRGSSHRRGLPGNPGIITKDPPSAPKGIVLPRTIFNQDPERNRGVPALWRTEDPGVCRMFTPEGGMELVKDVPTDDLIIATVVQYGCPRWFAEEVRRHPAVRFALAKAWATVQEAAEGDPEAKERLDYYRWAWAEARQVGLIHDRPEHTIGLFER